MKKVFLSLSFLFFSIFMFVSTASAEDYYNDYDWVCDYEFPVTPLVHCVDSKGEFEHNIYYFAAGNNKCLVVLCHGFNDNQGFGILMHGQFRHDYANAVYNRATSYHSSYFIYTLGFFHNIYGDTKAFASRFMEDLQKIV